MTYSEKLRHPNWQKKRLQILERDGWKCLACGSSNKNLQAVHIVFNKGCLPWEYADHCYQSLCDDCYKLRQELADKASNALRLALRDIPTSHMKAVSDRIITEALKEMEATHG